MHERFSEDQRIRSADIRPALADAQELPSFVTRHAEPKKTAFVGKTFVGCEEFRAELSMTLSLLPSAPPRIAL